MPRLPGVLGAILAAFFSCLAVGASCDDSGTSRGGGYESSSITADAAAREAPYINAQNALQLLNEAARMLKADYYSPEYRAIYQQRQSEVQAAQAQLNRYIQQQAMAAHEAARLRQMLTAEVDVNAGVRNLVAGPPESQSATQNILVVRVEQTGPSGSVATANPQEVSSSVNSESRNRNPSAGEQAGPAFVDGSRENPDFGAFAASPPTRQREVAPHPDLGFQSGNPADRAVVRIDAANKGVDRGLASQTSLSITRSPREKIAPNASVLLHGDTAVRGPASFEGSVESRESSFTFPVAPVKEWGFGFAGVMLVGFLLLAFRNRTLPQTEVATPVFHPGAVGLSPQGSFDPTPDREGGDNLSIERNPHSAGWVLVRFAPDRGRRIVAIVLPGSVVRGSRLAGFPLQQRFRLNEADEWESTQERERLVFEVDQDLMFRAG